MQVPDRHTKRLLISSTLPEKARTLLRPVAAVGD